MWITWVEALPFQVGRALRPCSNPTAPDLFQKRKLRFTKVTSPRSGSLGKTDKIGNVEGEYHQGQVWEMKAVDTDLPHKKVLSSFVIKSPSPQPNSPVIVET